MNPADIAQASYRYFTSYTGVRLPFRLVEEMSEPQIANRNTFIRAWFNKAELLLGFDKMVYGEIELSHRYTYRPDDTLCRAEIVMLEEDEIVVMEFDAAGAPLPA